jgi:hypothetical protein
MYLETHVVFTRLETILHNATHFVIESAEDILTTGISCVRCISDDIHNHDSFLYKIIDKLKKDLYEYLKQELNQSLPNIEKTMDTSIDNILPIESEEIKKLINITINDILDELAKRINDFLESHHT